METRAPESCRHLRSLLRGLPSAVYHAVTGTSLQRSGCVHCGIGPHSTNDCPVLGAGAEAKAARLYRRWAGLIGDELLVFSRSSSSQAYVDGAALRLNSRNDLPKRPPRRMKAITASVVANSIPVKKPPQLSDPILPDPPPPVQPPKPAPKLNAHPLQLLSSTQQLQQHTSQPIRLLQPMPKAACNDAPKPRTNDAPKPAPKDAPKPASKEAPKPAPKDAPKPAPKDAPKSAPKTDSTAHVALQVTERGTSSTPKHTPRTSSSVPPAAPQQESSATDASH